MFGTLNVIAMWFDTKCFFFLFFCVSVSITLSIQLSAFNTWIGTIFQCLYACIFKIEYCTQINTIVPLNRHIIICNIYSFLLEIYATMFWNFNSNESMRCRNRSLHKSKCVENKTATFETFRTFIGNFTPNFDWIFQLHFVKKRKMNRKKPFVLLKTFIPTEPKTNKKEVKTTINKTADAPDTRTIKKKLINKNDLHLFIYLAHAQKHTRSFLHS